MSSDTKDLEKFLSTYRKVPSKETFHPGDLLAKWRITGFLGRGGSGEVYRVEDHLTKTEGALKVFIPRSDKSESQKTASRNHFLHEIKLLSQNHYSFFPKFLDSGEEAGYIYLVTELLQPIELPNKDREVAAFMLELSHAVRTLHLHGLVHRDIKPQNILRRANGDLVLIDFGLVKEMGGMQSPPMSPVTIVDGKIVCSGTPGYAAPEQMRGGKISPAADIHALGMLINECFDGAPPGGWEEIVNRSTSSIPARRYPEVSAFIRAIRLRHLASRIWRTGIILFILLLIAILGGIQYNRTIATKEKNKTVPPPVKVVTWETVKEGPDGQEVVRPSSDHTGAPASQPKKVIAEKEAKSDSKTSSEPFVIQPKEDSTPKNIKQDTQKNLDRTIAFEDTLKKEMSFPTVARLRVVTNLALNIVYRIPYREKVDLTEYLTSRRAPDSFIAGVTHAEKGSVMYLNNETNVFDRPLTLQSNREYWIIGPGILDASLEVKGGSKVHLFSCFFLNRTPRPLADSGIIYYLSGGVYLNFTKLEWNRSDRANFLRYDGERSNDVRYQGPETSEELHEEDRRRMEYLMRQEVDTSRWGNCP